MQMPIKSFRPSEIKNDIDNDLKSSKAPGYELITNRILKNLSNKVLTFVTALFNFINRVPFQWKFAQMITIKRQIMSYRIVRLVFFQLYLNYFKKLLLKRLQ